MARDRHRIEKDVAVKGWLQEAQPWLKRSDMYKVDSQMDLHDLDSRGYEMDIAAQEFDFFAALGGIQEGVF